MHLQPKEGIKEVYEIIKGTQRFYDVEVTDVDTIEFAYKVLIQDNKRYVLRHKFIKDLHTTFKKDKPAVYIAVGIIDYIDDFFDI